MTDPTAPLSEFISNLSDSDIPDRVRRRARLITIDAIANAFAGWQASETKSILGLAQTIGGDGHSTVIGGRGLSPAGATLMNAYLITAVSACDVYRPALCHVTPEVIPTALALAEQLDASGQQFLLAIAIGLETTVRLGLGFHYAAFRARGWHSPGVVGPFGAAAAASKLLGLNVSQSRNALGLAGSQASGTFAAFGTAAVKFHQAHGALAGLCAGILAAHDFQTTGEILTHPDGGLFNAMSDGGDPEAVVHCLGERWELENISLRLWPTAAALQSVVGSLLALGARYNLRPEDVRQVQIGLSKAAYEMNGKMGWQNRLSAMLSARYVASVVLRDRACWLEQFDAAHLADPSLLKFAESRVEVNLDPTVETDGAAIVVRTVKGEELIDRRAFPKGDPRDPLTSEEIFSKFQSFAEPRLGTSGLGRAKELLERVETLESIRTLCASIGINQ
jgi:2-methylcitrate dehydratase PrpD